MEGKLKQFLCHLSDERGCSANTIAGYQQDLKRYVDYLQWRDVKRINAITPEHISELLVRWSKEGISSRSIARKLSSIKSFHRFLVLEGYTELNPVAKIEGPKKSSWTKKLPVFLTIGEMVSLLGQPTTETPLGLRDRAILEFLYATGVRCSELIQMKKGDLLFRDGLIQVIMGKGQKDRVVPIGKKAIKAVEVYVESARPKLTPPDSEEILFLNDRGGSLSRMGLWKIIRKYVERAGIKKVVTPHTIRHTFATHLLQGGAGMIAIQQMLGHSDISTTEIYSHVDRKFLKHQLLLYHPKAKMGVRLEGG